jgi:phosphoribosylformylglycinamidine synthase
MIGICNGFQILTHAGFLPGALVRNDSERYTCRWVDVAVKGSGPWLTDGMKLSLPIAHGEGKYVAPEDALQTLLSSKTETVLQYVPGPMSERYDLPYNPNGARHDIAGVTARNGRVLGLMPHPERAFFFTQRPDWTVAREAYREEKKRMPVRGDGAQLFTNAVTYFTS